jgi:prepilin-type N-terminal cleavage/methylation domain-containing protein
VKLSQKQAGFTLLELAIVIMLIGILASIFLSRMQRYQEFAEKTVVEATLANMRSGMRYRIAELMMNGRMNEMGSLSRENPMSWLKASPSNYLGQFAQAQDQRIPPGSWYFDQRRHELVYLLQHSRYFKPGPDGQKVIRFRVITSTQKQAANNSVRVEGISLAPVGPYDWIVF